MSLLEVDALEKHFPLRSGLLRRARERIRAVDGVSLRIERGTTLGLVGESGCGKTTVGRAVLRLTEPTAGRILFDGHDVTRASRREMRALRRRMQIVFQDPTSSLDPRLSPRESVAEPLRVHGMRRRDAHAKAEELLATVGLRPEHADRYPHELSGGQRQRVGIARALALSPDLVVLDEPTSALDVSVQAQVLNLLRKLQRDLGLAYLFISHDLAVVRHLCDEVAVMYLGRIVEQGPVERVFRAPQHPYTQALLAAVPRLDRRHADAPVLHGDVPSAIDPPHGCRFHPRCPRAQLGACDTLAPKLEQKAPGSWAACHFPGADGATTPGAPLLRARERAR